MDVQGLKVLVIDDSNTIRRTAETLLAKPYADFGSSTRIVVLNSLVEGHEHRYYAIICKGFPHTVRVEEDSVLSAQDEVEIATCISLSFDLDGQHLDLPNFEEIETHLRDIPHNQ